MPYWAFSFRIFKETIVIDYFPEFITETFAFLGVPKYESFFIDNFPRSFLKPLILAVVAVFVA